MFSWVETLFIFSYFETVGTDNRMYRGSIGSYLSPSLSLCGPFPRSFILSQFLIGVFLETLKISTDFSLLGL